MTLSYRPEAVRAAHAARIRAQLIKTPATRAAALAVKPKGLFGAVVAWWQSLA